MRHSLVALTLALLSSPAVAAPELRQLPRSDGTPIFFAIDRPEREPQGILLLAQGSGCLPTAANQSFDAVRQAFPGHIAVMVEKRGVAPDAPIRDGFADCPDTFHVGHTVTQRVEDYAAVLGVVSAETAGSLVLFGGSEGGLAVAMLAARTEPDAVIILSSATGIAFADMVLSTIPPEGHETVRAGFAKAMSDPEGITLFAGASHRFWADIMDKVPADFMLEAAAPLLVIQGGRDTSSPVAAARATADRFATAGNCNLTYWEFPALDHGMVGPDGTAHLPDIARAAALWAEAAKPCGTDPATLAP